MLPSVTAVSYTCIAFTLRAYMVNNVFSPPAPYRLKIMADC